MARKGWHGESRRHSEAARKWNPNKVVRYISAPNEEEALKSAKERLHVEGYEVYRVQARAQTIKGYPHKYPYTYGIYIRQKR